MTWSWMTMAWLHPAAARVQGVLTRKSLLRHLGATLRHFGTGLLVSAGGFAFGLWYQPAPVSTLDLHEADRGVVRGGVLYLSATVDQQRVCVTTVRRWLWRPAFQDAAAVEYAYLPGVPFRPPTPAGIDRYILGIPIPPYVEAGDWHYLAELQDQCSWWRRWFQPITRSPDLRVRIDEPTPADPAQVVAPFGAVELLRSDQKPSPEPRP